MAHDTISASELQRLLIQDAPIAFAVFDRDIRYLMATRRWLELHELTEHEVTGRSHQELFPATPEPWKHFPTRALAGECIAFENHVAAPAGARSALLRWKMKPWHTCTGAIGGIIVAAEDVTLERHHERMLMESMLQLDEAQALAHVGFWQVDLRTGAATWSDESFRIFGYAPGSFQPTVQSYFDALPPDELPRVMSTSREIEAGGYGELEHRIARPDGSIRHVLASMRGENDAAGKLVRITGSVQDITERKREQRQMELMKFSADHLSDCVSWSGRDARLLYVNDAFCRSLGYSREEMLKMRITDFDPDYPPELWPQHWEDLKRHGSLTFESRHVAKDGTLIPVEVNVNYIKFGDEEYNCAYVRNIAQRKQAEEQLKLAALVFDNAGEGVLVTDEHNRIIAANPAFTEITGYALDEVMGKNPKIFQSGRHDDAFYQAMWAGIEEENFWQGEIWDRKKNGELHAKMLTISAIRHPGGIAHRYVALFADITERKQSEEAIWRHANYDGLTGLPNRQMLRDRLELEARKSTRTGNPMALMLIDLDRFKDVNDSLGHHWGDTLLVDAAQRISSCVRESDTVARLGGDEFVILLGDLDEALSIDRVADDLIARLSAPFRLGADEIYITASIGISLYPTDSPDLTELLKNADQAMYSAKNAGRNRYHFFTPDMQESAQRRLRLASDLHTALAADQFVVYYQPIVELATGAIRKAEALLRWRHPEKGMIDPSDFVPIAEDTGLIIPIDDRVFREAVERTRHWRAAFHEAFQISVNASPLHFHLAESRHSSWPDFLRQQGVPGSAITIEITERLLMGAEQAVKDRLLGYHNLGVEIAIDDFGTGYSSLAYIRDFDVDYLKIDRSFVSNIVTDKGNQALCEAMIVMAHKLGMRVVAEGVESAAQRDLLREIGCDYAQGYLFSRPLPAPQFEELLRL